MGVYNVTKIVKAIHIVGIFYTLNPVKATKINNLPLLKYESYKVRIWWPPAHKQSSVKIGGIQNPYEQENNMTAFISQIIVTVIFFNGICQVIPIFAFLFF